MKRLILLLALASAGCAHKPLQPDNTKVTILTYNVENLFDTSDDPEKLDDPFVPAVAKEDPVFQNKCRVENSHESGVRECLTKDWSPARLERKLSRLTDVISQVGKGYGPDILIVEETESRQVLEHWRDTYMQDMGYKTLSYIKGPDERGINPAVFSRLPMIDPPQLHEINFATVETDSRPSRGILETHLRLPNGETLYVFAVHFPSQGAPTPFRKVAVQELLDIAGRLPAGSQILVGGDFNITSKEEFKEKIFKNQVSKEFAVSHLVGCHDCAGTIYYPKDGTWSFFDVLLFSKSLSTGGGSWRLDPSSIKVVNSSVYQVRNNGTPSRFGTGGGETGVSDHWPMYAELHLNHAAVPGNVAGKGAAQ
jgi:endonuclease/exonuclease/phosphatase family metal-dependent hydrolase